MSVTANTHIGSYTVTVAAAGFANVANFALTNTVGAVASITATGGGGQSTLVNAYSRPRWW